MTRNEVRALEELNALDGLGEPLTPVNEQLMSQVEETIKQMKPKMSQKKNNTGIERRYVTDIVKFETRGEGEEKENVIEGSCFWR